MVSINLLFIRVIILIFEKFTFCRVNLNKSEVHIPFVFNFMMEDWRTRKNHLHNKVMVVNILKLFRLFYYTQNNLLSIIMIVVIPCDWRKSIILLPMMEFLEHFMKRKVMCIFGFMGAWRFDEYAIKYMNMNKGWKKKCGTSLSFQTSTCFLRFYISWLTRHRFLLHYNQINV